MFRKSQFLGCCVLWAVLTGSINTAAAQAKKSVPINVVFAGVDRLYEDLDYVFDLAKEPDHLKTLKETLDVFFGGMDNAKPAVIQVYVRSGKFNLVLHAPTANAGVFRTNVRALGVIPKRIGVGLFAVTGLFKGFLKEVNGAPQQDSTTIIAEDRADLTPLGLFVQVKKKLDPQDYDFVASIINTADLQKDRENAVELVRKQVVDVLKKTKDETDAQHALRKLTIDQQVTEIKQIYGEAELISAVGNVSKKDKHALLASELKALPGTSLAEGISLLGKDASYFANIPLGKKEALSGMINFKLDAMRQKHLLNFLKQVRPLVHKEIEEADASSPDLKTFAGPATDIIFDVFEQSTTNGVLDGFVDVKVNADKLHTMVGGTKGDGAVVKKGLLKLKEKVTVEMDYAKIGEVSLHKVTLPKDMPELHEIFGKDSFLIVGTGTNAIWYATGSGAEAALKAAIADIEKPAAEKSNVIASLHAKTAIWFKLFDALRLKTKKGNPDARKEAIATLEQGDDTFDYKLELDKETLKSSLILNEGMLRYFGKVGAKFVKENLQN